MSSNDVSTKGVKTTCQPTITYLSNARLPGDKANSYQTIKMCEAFGSAGCGVELLYPSLVQPARLRKIQNIYEHYAVEPNFVIKELFCPDTLYFARNVSATIHKLLKLSYLQWSVYGLRTLLYCRKYRARKNHLFYGRDESSFAILSRSRLCSNALYLYEAHVFPGARWRQRRLALLKNLDGLIVITQQLKRLYMESGIPEEKLLVAPDGVDVEQFSTSLTQDAARHWLKLPSDSGIIGYIGRFQTLDMHKGIPELIQALPHLTRSIPKKLLLVCVGGPMECVPEFRDIMKAAGVPSDQVLFVDKRPTLEVPLWMRACDVCTIPWPWNPFSAYYTSPLKLFEYMAVGVPIVASRLPSLAEILRDGENAILVSPGVPFALAKGIQQVLEQPVLGGRIARQARLEVEDYTWDFRAKKILSFIEELNARKLAEPQ